MSTQGFITFAANGEEKTTYNNNSSQPRYLGVVVLAWLQDAMLLPSSLRAKILGLRVLDPARDGAPTNDDLLVLRRHVDTGNPDGADDRRARDWYWLLRDLQGDPAAILDAGYALEAVEFPLDSLNAEWGYVVDVDAGTFEIYRGLQRLPHDKGRFARRGGMLHVILDGFYPVALAASWPLDALPTEEEFLTVLAQS